MAKKLCCDGMNVKIGLYKPLSQRLLDFGNETYSDFTSVNTLMWMFIFYDGNTDCPKCKSSLSDIHDWFYNKGLLDNKNGMVKIVVEPEPEKCKIYTDFGFTLKPMHIFCDSKGNIFDIFTGLPDVNWLDKHILPYINMNVGFNKIFAPLKETGK